MKLTKEELKKLIKEEIPILPRGWDMNRLIQLEGLLTVEVLDKMGLELGEDIDVMEWLHPTDRGYRIVIMVSEPAPKPPPPDQNTKAKGTHLSLVRENKITKSQLRQIIKEEIEAVQSDIPPRGDS